MSRRPSALALILALSLAVRVAVVLLSPDYAPLYDSADYARHAASIAAGEGYPRSVLTPTDSPSAFRPPLYPYLLGGIEFVFGDVETAGRLAGALLGVLAVLLVYLIARRVWSERVALAAGALAALFPGLVLLTESLVTEPAFIVAELAAVLFALRAREAASRKRREAASGKPRGDLRWAAAAGVCCGLAALTRSNGILLVLPIAVGLWTVRPRISRAGLAAPAVVALCALLTVAPWALRNSLVFDRLVGFNVQTGYGLAGTYNGNAYERDGHRAVWIPPRFTDRYRALYERGDLDEAELDSILRREAVEYAVENPRYTIETTALNALRMFELTGDHPDAIDANRAQLAWSDAEAQTERVSFYLLCLLALAGVVWTRREIRRVPGFVWAVPLLCLAVVFPVIGSTRYRTVAYPFLALAAAPALVAGSDRPRRARGREEP